MNSNETQRYQEINLVSLLWHICSRWRMLVLIMLLCAALAGCYQVHKNTLANTAAREQREDMVSGKGNPAYDSLPPAEAAAVDNAVIYAEQLKMFLQYQKESVYIHLDPYHENVQILSYIVQVDQEQIAEDGMNVNTLAELLKQSYVNYISSGAAAGRLAESGIQIGQSFIGELVSAEEMDCASEEYSYQEDRFTTRGSTTTFSIESDNSHRAYAMFKVRVLGSTPEDAEDLAEAVNDALKEYSETLTGNLGLHTITLSDSSASVVVDTGLVSARQSLQSNLINYRTNLNNTLGSFNDAQKSAYEQLTGNAADAVVALEDDSDADSAGTDSVLPAEIPLTSGLGKYILLGLAAGLMLASVLIAMGYVLVPTLKTTEDITRCFNYYLMADLSGYQELPRRFGLRFDRWLHSLRYRDSLPLEEEQRFLATNLKVTCRNEEISSVYLTSSYHMTHAEAGIIQELIDALAKEGIAAVYGSSIERDAESYERMSDTGAVVYIEKLGKSRFDVLENIDAMTARQGVKILGVIAM